VITVPNIVAGLPGVRLRAAADAMAGRLRSLHEAAILDADTTEFVLDPRARTDRVSTEAGIHALPPVVSAVGFRPTALLPAGHIARVRFYADGSASGGTIRLRHGDRSVSIVIDWLTGRVSRHD
jgi:general secretion pathway protein H